MRKLVLHVKRLFRKFWLFIALMFAMSPVIGLPVFLIMLAISLLCFSDPLEPINVEEIIREFTEEELSIINGEIAEGVTDDEFFRLLAKYDCFICPRRVDSATIWNGSEVTENAYICHYELNDHYRWLNKHYKEGLKERILSKLDTTGIHVQRLIRTNRNLIFRYWFRHADGYTEVVITPEELTEYKR